jgi:hypothetical protein
MQKGWENYTDELRFIKYCRVSLLVKSKMGV